MFGLKTWAEEDEEGSGEQEDHGKDAGGRLRGSVFVSAQQQAADDSEASSEGSAREVTNDEDYDTDLDYTEPRQPLPGPLDPERVRLLYRRACAREGVIPCGRFLRALSRNRVEVNTSGLDARDVKAIAVSLLNDVFVQELWMRGNRMGPGGMAYLRTMCEHNRTLTVLDVSDCMLGTRGAELLAMTIMENDSLLSIRAAGNKFATKAGYFIGEGLKKNGSLKQLDLSRNLFCEEGAVYIAEGLAENSTLQGVDLSYNHIRTSGMKTMGRMIEENIGIRYLDLSWNGVGPEGAKRLGEALNINYRLLSLVLQGCRMTAESLFTLISSMPQNDTFKNLDVTHNPITNSDAVKLMKTLLGYPSLGIEHIQMTSVMVSKEFLALVEEMRRKKPTFTVAYMGLMAIGDKSVGQMGTNLSGGDALGVLIRYTRAKNLRLVDLFSRLDTDKSCTITRAELVHGVRDAGIPLSIADLDRLVNKVDADGDGEIDFRELLVAYKQYVRDMHKRGVSMRRSRAQQEDAKLRRETALRKASENVPKKLTGSFGGQAQPVTPVDLPGLLVAEEEDELEC